MKPLVLQLHTRKLCKGNALTAAGIPVCNKCRGTGRDLEEFRDKRTLQSER
jgi:hypothetical protein